jgi:hypothetical protein
MAPFVVLFLALLPQLCVAFHIGSLRRSSSYVVPSVRQSTRLTMTFGGIAEKLGGIVEFISGQQKVTEANIEDTLKVQRMKCFRNST